MQRLRCSLFLFGILVFGLRVPAHAQNRSLLDLYKENNRSPLSSRQIGQISNRLSEQARNELTALTGVALTPLDGPVDPKTYIVGPSDQFGILIGGIEPLQSIIPVTADGYLVILGAGRIRAAGLSLEVVQKKAMKALKKQFQNVPVEIALMQPRIFYVYVTGAVPEPGRHLAFPVARVEDVLKGAFRSETFEAPVSNPNYRPALRNVEIIHKDSSRQVVDLVRYYQTGDLTHNPYVQDGDAIRVPAFHPKQSALFINGAVAFDGFMDFRPGDTLLDVLQIAVGPTDLSTLSEVHLTRRHPNGQTTTTTYRLKDLLAEDANPVAMQPLDHVYVPQRYRDRGIVAIEGEVRFPGTFSIDIGKTTLKDLVDQAGGLRPEALLRGAYIERGTARLQTRKNVAEELDYIQSRRVVGLFRLIQDSSAVLEQARLGNLDFLSRYYLIRSLYLENRISVDVETALQPDAEPVYLMDGDKLVVPRDVHTVRVVGEVVRPGEVMFKAGLSAEGYVNAAGGKGPLSTDVYVIKAGTGQLVAGTVATVLSGDIIFVDRKGGDPTNSDLARLAIQKQDQSNRKFQIVLQTVGVITSIASTIILYLRLSN